MPERTPRGSRWRWALVAAIALVALDGFAWWFHVQWRNAGIAALEPVAREIDVLAAQIREDDEWIRQNGRLLQEYGRYEQFNARLQARGNRARAHDALVDSYNREVAHLWRRFYLAPVASPHPPLKNRLSGPIEGRPGALQEPISQEWAAWRVHSPLLGVASIRTG